MSFLTPISEKKYKEKPRISQQPMEGSSQTTTTTPGKLTKITPKPHFVIKTRIFSPYKDSPAGTKLFINVCTNGDVPVHKSTPEILKPEVLFPLIMENKWEIPILCSSDGVRHDKDKKGARSLVIDCVINERMMRWCELNKDLKLILIEWCFDAVEFKEEQPPVEVGINIGSGGTVGLSSSSLVIDRDVMVVPKRTYMGGDGYPPDMEVDLGALQMESDEIHEAVKSIAEEEKSSNAEQKQSGESTVDLLAKLKQGGGGSSDSQEEKKVKKPIIEEIDEVEAKKIKKKSEKRTKFKSVEKTSTMSKTKTGSETERKLVIEKEISEKYKGKKLLMKIGVDVEVAEADEVEVAVNRKRGVVKLSYGAGKLRVKKSVEVALPHGEQEQGDETDAKSGESGESGESGPKEKMCGVFVRKEKSLYLFT
ncbi:unnamed protein product [Ambrosiozyma monospora]|uniref:Unnamed protein product n=1 Tax=Ambrosiozyma monospora TaxID=43982 RepID=A0ACB5T167_AMBMO|nr:unnamed protein product [Ambrosiozyma monospora]